MCEGLSRSCTFTASVESDMTNLFPAGPPRLITFSAFKGPCPEKGPLSLSLSDFLSFPDYCCTVKKDHPTPIPEYETPPQESEL